MAHVGDVHHPQHVVAAVAQIFFQHILHDIGAQVADMGEMIDRGAAGIKLHLARLVGIEFLFFMGEGIVKLHKIMLLSV